MHAGLYNAGYIAGLFIGWLVVFGPWIALAVWIGRKRWLHRRPASPMVTPPRMAPIAQDPATGLYV